MSETMTEWDASEPADLPQYVPLDMARNIDDDRVRERIAWIDGFGRAYAHSLGVSADV